MLLQKLNKFDIEKMKDGANEKHNFHAVNTVHLKV